MSTLVNDGQSAALFAALLRQHTGYKRTGYLSTTSCVEAPQIRCLQQRHDNEIIVPASTLIPSFVGTCVHTEIEKYEKGIFDGVYQEQEFVIESCGTKFSGRPDMYDVKEEEVGDEKCTSVWTFRYNRDGKKEHISQININAYLLRRAGFKCHKGWIELIFMDWKLSEARRDQSYPRRTERIFLTDLWSDEYTKDFIDTRVQAHLNADKLPDELLPPCTGDDQWRKPHAYAVFKKGNSRATKVFESKSDAEELRSELGRIATIEERPGERTRCEDYCLAKPFCHQYKREHDGV